MSLRAVMAASAAACNRCGAVAEEEAAPTDHTAELAGLEGDPPKESRDPRVCVDVGRTRAALANCSSRGPRSTSTGVCPRLDASNDARGGIGAAATAAERAPLADAIRRMERTREMGRRCDPHETLKLWRQLGGGRLSVVATCATEGRRMILARRTLPGGRDPKTLSPRVRDVIGYAAMGHSNKLIAYVMGISAPAVAKHLRRAKKTVGVSTRRELIALFEGGVGGAGSGERAGSSTELPRPYQLRVYRQLFQDGEFVLFDWPIRQRPLPRSLTAAEREVVRRALVGESNLEIARARGTSTRTVANQMANVFRKLGVGSRLELFALLGGG